MLKKILVAVFFTVVGFSSINVQAVEPSISIEDVNQQIKLTYEKYGKEFAIENSLPIPVAVRMPQLSKNNYQVEYDLLEVTLINNKKKQPLLGMCDKKIVYDLPGLTVDSVKTSIEGVFAPRFKFYMNRYNKTIRVPCEIDCWREVYQVKTTQTPQAVDLPMVMVDFQVKKIICLNINSLEKLKKEIVSIVEEYIQNNQEAIEQAKIKITRDYKQVTDNINQHLQIVDHKEMSDSDRDKVKGHLESIEKDVSDKIIDLLAKVDAKKDALNKLRKRIEDEVSEITLLNTGTFKQTGKRRKIMGVLDWILSGLFRNSANDRHAIAHNNDDNIVNAVVQDQINLANINAINDANNTIFLNTVSSIDSSHNSGWYDNFIGPF